MTKTRGCGISIGRGCARLKRSLRAKRQGLSLTDAQGHIDTHDSPRDTAAQLATQMKDLQVSLDERKLHQREAKTSSQPANASSHHHRMKHSHTTNETPLQRVQRSLERQGLMRHLGVELLRVVSGECVVTLPFSDKTSRQHGAFHGGAVGALADIAGGYAALTVAPADMAVVNVEYKINFLATCQGGELCATGRVVNVGQRLIVTSAEVSHIDEDGTQTLCAVMQQTVMLEPKSD